MKTYEDCLRELLKDSVTKTGRVITNDPALYKEAARLYAVQFVEAADEIIIPALDILPETYNEEINHWAKICKQVETYHKKT